MPVECTVDFVQMSQDEFHALDKRVMRHAFDIHNTMGRFFDERIYQEELAQRCCADGMTVEREVHVRVMHRSFSKSYFLDLLIEKGGLYELKATEALHNSHDKQVINYLLLAGLMHGKLVNMRPASVESRFVSTTLSPQDRAEFRWDEKGYDAVSDADHSFQENFHALLNDWGAFLDVNLYQEALIYLSGGLGGGVKPVDIVVNGRVVGHQKMCVLDGDTIWHLSSVRDPIPLYQTHLLRFFRHTRMQRMHWINLNHRNITIQTLKNDSVVK
jgi:GxxExxY protein